MYELRQPHPDLAPYVANYWFVSSAAGPVDLCVYVFVDGQADLLFNHGVGYTREVVGGETTAYVVSNLDAQRLVPLRIVQRGDVGIAGVRFRLGGLSPFVPGDLRPLTGTTPAITDVFGPETGALDDSLASASPDEGARLLDDFLRARLRPKDGRSAFERALERMTATDGTCTVRDAAHAARVSARQLDRIFAREVGLPPKTVARILRFQGALRALMRDAAVPLAEVAVNAGYFDQAHFIRDFRRFSGGVPRGYKGYYPPVAPTDFAPNVVAFVQDPDPADRAG